MPTEGINPHELMKILLYGSQEHTDPRGTPIYKPYRYVPPQRVGFLCLFGLKTGIDFAHIVSGIGCVSIPNEQERKRYMQVRMEVKRSFFVAVLI